MRLRNNPEAKNILNNSNHVIKKFPVKLTSNFVLEIGMGKGEMISGLAEANPETNYIGLEKFATVAEKCLKKINEKKIENLKLICEDAKTISEFFTGSPGTIWLTFSDPWPKARHEKRRLTSEKFLDEYKKIMSKDTVLKLKTDNDKFFEYSVESLKENGFTLKNVTRDFHSEDFCKGNIMTGYELKWSSRGKKINYLEARK